MRARLLPLALLAVLAASGAGTAPRQILFWAPYGAGTPEQADETMASFGRYVAGAAGWGPASARVSYRNTVEGGREALEEEAPDFLVVPMPVWLRHHEERGWRPLLELVTDGADAQRYSLYGPPGASLASLAGAPIRGAAAYDAAFVAGLVLDEGEGPLRYGLEPTARPLSAVRQAARGERVLVLLDEAQRSALDALPGGGGIELLAESPWMPAGVLVATPGAADEDIRAITGALSGAGEDERAAEILKTMKIRRFDPMGDDELAALGHSYASARRGIGPDASAG